MTKIDKLVETQTKEVEALELYKQTQNSTYLQDIQKHLDTRSKIIKEKLKDVKSKS